MAQLTFETISFQIREQELEVSLLRSFVTKIPLSELENIAPFTLIDPRTIEFKKIDQDKAEIKFSFLLGKYLDSLTSKITGNPATYIHRNSGIPLIGNVAFGIVYRNSSIIEIKPNNSCNLDCVYCSIGEGLSSKKHDFVIEKDYLVEELQKLIAFLNEEVEIHIGVQGEPFLYGDMENLIHDLQKITKVHTISIDTNGTLLSKEMIDRLSQNDKLQFNLSLDAIESDAAKKVAGTKTYNVKQVMDIIAYATEKMNRTPIVAPVLTKGFNETEMEKIIQWIKTLKKQPHLGIQNFLRYKTGRNPGQEITWDDFYALLDRWEKQYDIKLRWTKEDFKVRKTKELPKPFVEGDVITAIEKSVGRFPHEIIAVAQGRNISVPSCEFKKEKKIKVKIVRDKHNVFVGQIFK